MFRFIIAGCWTVIFLILSIPIIFIEWLIGFKWPEKKALSSQWIVTRAFRVLLFISGTVVETEGLENLIKDRPVLYVPNHRSIYDIIITYPMLPSQTGYIAKKEIRFIPVFSTWMKFMNCYFLDRHDLRDGLKMINHAKKIINSGSSVCIFPEGTRNKLENDLLEFHAGCFKIAEKTKCPVICVTIIGSADIFENHLPFIKKTKVKVIYSKPIYTDDYSKEDFKNLSSLVREQITENLKNN